MGERERERERGVRWVSGWDRGAADSVLQIACAHVRQIARALVRRRYPAKDAAHAPRLKQPFRRHPQQAQRGNLLCRTRSIEKTFYRAPIQKAIPASATRISLSPGSDSALASCIRNRAVNARLIFASMYVGMMYA